MANQWTSVDPATRFWSYVTKTSTCWLWTGVTNEFGYGRFWSNRRMVTAHRWAFEHLREPIPDGLVLDHLCRVRNCVNPEHLEIVTQRTNILRGEGVAARNAMATHCIHGHAFTSANTYYSQGKRSCVTCRRAGDRNRTGKTIDQGREAKDTAAL